MEATADRIHGESRSGSLTRVPYRDSEHTLAYAADKGAAERRRWRTMESTLQTMALIGGWPGAWIAQQDLRHKARKASFQEAFWFVVVINIAVLTWLAITRMHPLEFVTR
ncbi:MAG: DUF1294 domain-containing protein [Steroidobacterales bacterium]